MLPGFDKIVEERIRDAQRRGYFENLTGAGQPLNLEEDRHIAEELRLVHKILKNADCLPPEIELKKEIQHIESLISGMRDTEDKYRAIKKLNFLVLKLNSIRKTPVMLEEPQQYAAKLIGRLERVTPSNEKNDNT